jgi:hypothetical protein
MPDPPQIASTWTFTRGDDRIVIRCRDSSRVVILGESEVIRYIDFPTPGDRVAYQSALEAHLLRDGWSLLSFTTTGSGEIDERRGWLSWIRPKRSPRKDSPSTTEP